MRKLCLAVLLAALPALAMAAPGNADKGKEIYLKRCTWCHGDTGDASGPAAGVINPPPRDFTMGLYKFKTTPFDEIIPSDDDFHKMIKGGVITNSMSNWSGMNNTSMPGWGDMLTDQEIWDLVAFLKAMVQFVKPEKPPLSFDKKIASSADSIAKGKEIFVKICAECHGDVGRGDATKGLKDDLGFRTWPRNLTKPWTFRLSEGAEGIYTRISTGIPGTQMPSFADPSSQKKLSDEERWHVANYVVSLNAPYKKPGDDTVIMARRAEGELPADPNDPKWDSATNTSYYLVPQLIVDERHFTPSLDSISVKAMYNEKEIAMLVEWDDRTQSIPGNSKAIEIAGQEVSKDGVAVQFPANFDPTTGEKPYFVMGDPAHPVNIWNWTSESSQEGQSVALLDAKGFKESTPRAAGASGLSGKGVFDKGTWKVVFKRPLHTEQKDSDIQFTQGVFIPIAFAARDGSNGETDSKFEMTTWYWLFLDPPTSSSVFLIPILVGLLVLGGEWWLVRSYRK